MQIYAYTIKTKVFNDIFFKHPKCNLIHHELIEAFIINRYTQLLGQENLPNQIEYTFQLIGGQREATKGTIIL